LKRCGAAKNIDSCAQVLQFKAFRIMPEFTYKARSAAGRIESGVLEASDRRQAAQRLQGRGLQPVALQLQAAASNSAWARFRAQVRSLAHSLKPTAAAGESGASAARPRRGPSREKVGLQLLKRLLELHSSGLPVGDSIKILSQRLQQAEQKALAQALWRELSEGSTLAGALTRQPKYFAASVSYVIEAGEATGSLAPILHKVIDYLEEKQAIRQKMLASMAYPGFICTVAIGVVILFLTVLLPQIESMLARLGSEMTWSARLLIDGSELLVRYGPFGLLALAALALGLRQWRQGAAGRKATDNWFLRLPLIGAILRYGDLFQAGNHISTLLESGINTTETLRLTERTVSNTELRARFQTARHQVNEGLSIAQAFRRNQFMPDLALDILSVGEDTGNLGQSMHEVTKGFREELSKRLARLTQIVSSGALVCAFLLVALIAIGIVTSVFQVSQTLSM
jgi:type II secretory pathway component PulF